MASYENYGEETRWMLHQNVTYGIDKLINKEFYGNRLLASRGHVTNASFKHRVGILLMPKIDIAHKQYLTCEI